MAAILKIYLAISPAPKGQLTPNFVGDIGVTCRSKIAKIVQSDIQDAAILKIYFSPLLLNWKASWFEIW